MGIHLLVLIHTPTCTRNYSALAQRTAMCVVPFVCPRWRDVCRSLLTVHLDLGWAIDGDSTPLTDEGLQGMLNNFNQIESIDVRCSRRLTDASLAAMAAAGFRRMQVGALSSCEPEMLLLL